MRIKYESVFMFIVMILSIITVGNLAKIHIEAAEEEVLYEIGFDKEWDYSMEKEGAEYCYSKRPVTARFEVFDYEWKEPDSKPELSIEFTGKNQEETKIMVVNKESWRYEDGTLKAQYNFSEEGTYRYRLTYRAVSGKEVNLKSAQVITIDKTDPEIEIRTCGAVSGEDVSSIFQEAVKVRIRVKEENFNPEGFSYECRGSYYNDSGQNIKKDVTIDYEKDQWTRNDNDVWELNLYISENYIYDVSFTVRDYANRESKITFEFIIDQKKPTLAIHDIKGAGVRHIEYADFQYFGKSGFNISVSVYDEISGIKGIYYRIEEEGEEATEGYVANDSGMKGKWFCERIGLEGDFKGAITLWAVDFAGHKSDAVRTGGIMIESERQHSESTEGELKLLTKASNKVGDIFYFNKDVKFCAKINDFYSGLYRWSFASGQMLDEGNFFHLLKKTSQWEKEFFIKSSEVNQKESSSPVSVVMEWEDNAGHITSLRKNIVIDVVKPEIQVEWEDAESKQYYNKKRTATITVCEANFDEGSVEWEIDGWNKEAKNVSISEWTHKKEIHSCKVVFEEDGEYQLKIKVADLASNKSSFVGEKFVLDCAKPIASVKIIGPSKERFYYNEDVLVGLNVQEAYFDEKKAEFYVEKDGVKVENDVLEWSKKDGSYVSTVNFSQEGKYSLRFRCTDKAGNSLDSIAVLEFILDQTSPSCRFTGVKNLSAYNGKVMPQVTYGDVNLDESSVEITMSGEKNGKVKYKRYPDKETKEGKILRWKDFARKEKVDDIYTLSVYLKDKAGNETKETLMFSVNRYGSSYQIGKDTKELLKDYYTNKDAVVTLTEVNVDALADRQVWIKHDKEKAYKLMEGRDYSVVQSKTAFGWMKYDYRIRTEVFVKDGLYKVTFYSKDKAGNEMNNQSRKKEIEFIVDRTTPQAIVTGLEEYEYVTKEQLVNIQFSDKYGIDTAIIYVNGQIHGEYTGAKILEASGRVGLKLYPKEEQQEIYVVLKDLAGNIKMTEKIGCMIHENVPKAFQNAVKVPEKEAESSSTQELETVETKNEEKEKQSGVWMGIYLLGSMALGIFILFPACKKRHFSIK